MPEQISVQKEMDGWRVNLSGKTEGQLRLVGMDTERRPLYDKMVPVTEGLSIKPGQLVANVNGYIMVQYIIKGVVKDVKTIRINP